MPGKTVKLHRAMLIHIRLTHIRRRHSRGWHNVPSPSAIKPDLT